MPTFKDVDGNLWDLPQQLMTLVDSDEESSSASSSESSIEPVSGPLRVPDPDAQGRIVLDKSAPYILDRDISQPQTGIYVANENVELDLNGHTVLAGQDGSAGPDDWYDMRAVVRVGLANHPKPLNFKLKGPGRLVSGPGALNHGVAGNDAYGVTVNGVTVEVSGPDSQPGRFRSDGPGYVYNSTLISRVTEWTNRHDTRTKMAFLCPGLTAEDNVIDGGVSGFIGGGIRRRNVIILDGNITNGAAFLLYGHRNCIVEDNVILNRNGRGVLVDDGGKSAGFSSFLNNFFFVLELPNDEYDGNQLTCNALKVRGQSYGVEALTWQGNDSVTLCGGQWVGGTGILNRNEHGVGSDGARQSNEYSNNRIGCVYLRPYTAGNPGGRMDTGSCLGFARCGREFVLSNDEYTNNLLETNLHAFQFSQDLDAGFRWTNHPFLTDNPIKRFDGETILLAFLGRVGQKLFAINKLNHPSVQARLGDIEALIAEVAPSCPLWDDGYDVYDDCERWDHHTRVTVQGSGELSTFQTGDSQVEVIPLKGKTLPTFPLLDDTGEEWLVEIDETTNTILSVVRAEEESSSSSPSSQSSPRSESSGSSEQSSGSSASAAPSGTLSYLQAATGRQKTFNTTWTDVPEQSITPEIGKEWLLLARNRANRDETKIAMRIVDGSLPFIESELHCNVMSSDNSTPYGFFTLSVGTGNPIKKQFKIEDGIYRIRAETQRLAALDLSPLTPGQDYYFSDSVTPVSLSTTWSTGASITLDVTEAGPYAILACDQIRTDPNMGSIDLLSRITLDGNEVLRIKQESRKDDLRKPVMLWWEDLAVGQHTIALQASAATSAHVREYSGLFLLRLKAFAAYAVDKNIPEVDLGVGTQGEPETEYPTVLNSLNLTMPNAGPLMMMSGTVEDGTQLGRNRIELDGAGVIADSEGTCVRWDGEDEQPNWLFHIEETTAGSHLIEQTAGDTPPNPSNNKCEDSVLVAFSLELA